MVMMMMSNNQIDFYTANMVPLPGRGNISLRTLLEPAFCKYYLHF